jgi:hypothetical protein
MHIKTVTVAPIESRDDKRLPFNREADVCDKTGVKYLVNDLSVVRSTFR